MCLSHAQGDYITFILFIQELRLHAVACFDKKALGCLDAHFYIIFLTLKTLRL